MSVVKFTKTSTFLFPLLGIPKDLFKCEIRNSFGTLIHSNRFINAYLYNDDLVADECIFLLLESYQDPNFNSFYTTLVSMENYVDDYEKEGYLVMIFNIPEEFIKDFELIVAGKYSQVSTQAKSLIFKNHFFSGKAMVLPMIFSKALNLKQSWEEKLSNPGINFYADLGNQEVWGIIDPDKETLNDAVIKHLTKKESAINK